MDGYNFKHFIILWDIWEYGRNRIILAHSGKKWNSRNNFLCLLLFPRNNLNDFMSAIENEVVEGRRKSISNEILLWNFQGWKFWWRFLNWITIKFVGELKWLASNRVRFKSFVDPTLHSGAKWHLHHQLKWLTGIVLC